MSSAIIIVQSVLTLGTATVAFLALRLHKEQWRSTREPDLHLQILLGQQSGTTDMAIVNIGGWARGALFAMSVGDQRASSYLRDSFIAPGERLYIHTELPQSEDTRVLLLFRGMDETSYRVVRGKPRETLSESRDRPETRLGREWAAVYPGDDWIDKTAVLQQVHSRSEG